jgi:rare lipoprotein A (peptidoglycan hydrolase)
LPVVAFDDRTAEQRVWRLGQLVVKATSTPATGRASWYAARGNVAAVHSWRRGDEPYRVRVCASRCVNVTVADWCQCFIGSSRERLIDLSDDAFRKLAPLSVGLLRVTVVRLPTR